MIIKFNKEISLTPHDVKDIIIKYLRSNHDLSGIFNVSFVVKNKPVPSNQYPQDSVDHWVFDRVEIKVSENET